MSKPDRDPICSDGDLRAKLKELDKALHDAEVLREDIERTNMQLAACGVAALCNTENSMSKSLITSDNPYWSASYQDVVNAVKREIRLRANNAELVASLKRVLHSEAVNESPFPEYSEAIAEAEALLAKLAREARELAGRVK